MSAEAPDISAAPGAWLAFAREARVRSERVSATAFVGAIVGAEILGALVSVVAGAALDGVVLLVLLNAAVLGLVRPASLLPPTLALVPLLRVLSVALPLRQVDRLAWYPLVGAPVLLGIALAARMVGVARPETRLRVCDLAGQVGIALTGVPLGAAAYLILRPHPIASLTWHGLAAAAVCLFLFAALVEELLFRRLLQDVFLRLLGPAGLLLTSVLYASTYAGSLSLPFAAFMGGTGLAFAFAVRRTGYLGGVLVAHTLLAVGLLVVWPALDLF